MMKDNTLHKKHHIGKAALTAAFAVISILWVFPVFMVVLNSFKVNTFVKTDTFAWPTGESFAGWGNFVKGVTFGGFPSGIPHFTVWLSRCCPLR